MLLQYVPSICHCVPLANSTTFSNYQHGRPEDWMRLQEAYAYNQITQVWFIEVYSYYAEQHAI